MKIIYRCLVADSRCRPNAAFDRCLSRKPRTHRRQIILNTLCANAPVYLKDIGVFEYCSLARMKILCRPAVEMSKALRLNEGVPGATTQSVYSHPVAQ
jgi:hypothetical protein